MSKNTNIEENGGPKPISEALKRFKRSRLVFESSLGILGFFLVGLCFVCSFFFFDYRSVAKSYGLSERSDRFVWLKVDNNNMNSSQRVGFLEESGNGCDVFDGDWVWDDTYPLYQSKDCRFLDEGFMYSDYERSDLFYTHWRWQPRHCNLPSWHKADQGEVPKPNPFIKDGREISNEEAPENNPQYTIVYVGNLSPEVTQLELHRLFYSLGAGVIEKVRVQLDKGFGFVRYNTHDEAALAIQMGNAQPFLYSRHIKCSWGSKPTPPGTASNPLPSPAPVSVPSLSAMDLLAYERQLALAKMHPQAQHSLRQAGLGVNVAGASAAMYDGGFQNVASTHQQLMYYQ